MEYKVTKEQIAALVEQLTESIWDLWDSNAALTKKNLHEVIHGIVKLIIVESLTAPEGDFNIEITEKGLQILSIGRKVPQELCPHGEEEKEE
jgi:hypothetical protein